MQTNVCKRQQFLSVIELPRILAVDLESTRDAAIRIHKAAGFRETGEADGILQLELTREEYLRGSRTGS